MRRRLAFVSMMAVLIAAPAAAQQRPLVTEDPETIGSGNILFEGGFDQQWEFFNPVSGLQGRSPACRATCSGCRSSASASV